MKKIYILFVLFALVSCVKDPWKEIKQGGWNRERTLLSIKLEGQVGETVVETIDYTNGMVSLELVPYIISDMSAVKIESMEISHEAKSDVKVGSTLDFSNGNMPTIEVTSIMGEKRTYYIKAKEFQETLLGNYKITGSMVLGGTGHVYGGAGLMSPESKSWVWAERGGYGPKAEYDNYLKFELSEFTKEGNTKGTVTHYAGVDGKFWNCMFAANQNKEGTTDIDLHKYYRNIPIGVSNWERNYTDNTITFTDKDGKVTVSRLFDAGKHIVLEAKEQGKEKVLNVSNQAFGFEIKGVDDWKNIYGDYDKFAKKAMGHFVLVEKVEAIPAEAMTEGSEGDISIEEPEPPAPLENLTGTYLIETQVVFSVSSDGSTVTLMNPQDKNWNFNNVDKEKDNKLILTATSVDASGNEIGDAEYTAGADEEYWDYTFIAGKCKHTTDAVDASDLYGFLPHGKSSYVYDKVNQKITFTQDTKTITVNVIPAGTYTYTAEGAGNSKTLNVSSIAFDFPMPAEYQELFSQIPGSWADSDWLLYWVKNYIMCFDKE